jgi:hypothetical protein
MNESKSSLKNRDTGGGNNDIAEMEKANEIESMNRRSLLCNLWEEEGCGK